MKSRSTVSFYNKVAVLLRRIGYLGGIFIVLAFIFNIFLGLFKQLIVQKKLTSRLETKKTELFQLKQANDELKKRLEETERPEFLNYEAARMFGLSRDGYPPSVSQNESEPNLTETQKEKVPNWQKWFNLFGF